MAGRPGEVTKREYYSLVAVGVVLLVAIWLARTHADALKDFADRHPAHGVFLYLALNVIDATVAPGASLPVIPVAARAWGRVPAALLTTAGWTIGSLAAFFIARRWGTPLVHRLTSAERVARLQPYIPRNPFWSVVLIRLVLPIGIVSYAIGLFTDMRWWLFTAATALGFIPSALLLTSLGRMTRAYEIITLLVACAVTLGIFWSMRSPSQRPMTSHPRHRPRFFRSLRRRV